jgi:tRNA G46 methylase TrmB
MKNIKKHFKLGINWQIYIRSTFMNLDLYNDSYDAFCSLLSQEKPPILEIGCGPGNITKYLLSKIPSAHWLGIDIAPE